MLLLMQAFFFLCFRARFCLLRSVNIHTCHLSGQTQLTGNRSLKNRDVLYQQMLKPSATSAWGGRLSSQEWGCLSAAGPSWTGTACRAHSPETVGTAVRSTSSHAGRKGPTLRPLSHTGGLLSPAQRQTQVIVTSRCAGRTVRTQ